MFRSEGSTQIAARSVVPLGIGSSQTTVVDPAIVQACGVANIL